MGKRATADISGIDIVDALLTNPRRLGAADMRRLLPEAADEIKALRETLSQVVTYLDPDRFPALRNKIIAQIKAR